MTSVPGRLYGAVANRLGAERQRSAELDEQRERRKRLSSTDVSLRFLPVVDETHLLLPWSLARCSAVRRVRRGADLADPHLMSHLSLDPDSPLDHLLVQSFDRRRSMLRAVARQEPPTCLDTARATWLDATGGIVAALLADDSTDASAARLLHLARSGVSAARSTVLLQERDLEPEMVRAINVSAARAFRPDRPDRTALHPSADDRALLVATWSTPRRRDLAIALETDVSDRWIPWSPDTVVLLARACEARQRLHASGSDLGAPAPAAGGRGPVPGTPSGAGLGAEPRTK